ncbi:lipase [Pseudozyma hubeiensis SY62]|uniref:Lipase n=1 Tax=Pseudozyma hubeiensis (strain SY62) TaxID=1305764 RepID=R9P6P8_PSEHS|nr:lipase [Pseudozyma hubeiensis SY62]GAC97014.1 lipase [Pseudozyma hubeiensis SY62]
MIRRSGGYLVAGLLLLQSANCHPFPPPKSLLKLDFDLNELPKESGVDDVLGLSAPQSGTFGPEHARAHHRIFQDHQHQFQSAPSPGDGMDTAPSLLHSYPGPPPTEKASSSSSLYSSLRNPHWSFTPHDMQGANAGIVRPGEQDTQMTSSPTISTPGSSTNFRPAFPTNDDQNQIAGSLSPQPLLPAPFVRIKQFEDRKRLRAPSRSDLADLVAKSEAAIRSQSLQDPTVFFGATFELAISPDAETDRFVSSLHLGESSASRVGWTQQPESKAQVFADGQDPFEYFRGLFRKRQEALQVIFPSGQDPRCLYLILLHNHPLIQAKSLARLLGVFEIGSNSVPNKLTLHFRGFHESYGTEYLALEQLPQATGRKYWFQQDRTALYTSKADMTMRIVKLDGTDSVQDRQQLALDSDEMQSYHPDVQELIRTGEVGRVLAMDHLAPGGHLYIYQESSEMPARIQRWKSTAGLPLGSFLRKNLGKKDKDEIAFVFSTKFRQREPVKVITEANGEMFMLSMKKKSGWVKNIYDNTMTVWQIGPEIQGRRLMICRGVYTIRARAYSQLTPQRLPGLRDSSFSNKMQGLP